MLFKSWIQNIGNINFPNICFKDTTAESSEMYDDEIGPITIVMLSAVIIVDDNSVIENHDGEENEGQKKMKKQISTQLMTLNAYSHHILSKKCEL